MTVRAVVAVYAAALLVAGCGGGGGNDDGAAKPVGGSNDTSVCTYTKPFGKGRVYVEIAVSPVSMESSVCRAFSGRFGGRKIRTDLPRGTGRPHCDYNKNGSSYTIKLGVFSSPHTGTGRAFCRSFHPGRGFKRVSLG